MELQPLTQCGLNGERLQLGATMSSVHLPHALHAKSHDICEVGSG